MNAQKCTDFRDWDILPETSMGGVDNKGMPFYIWRESADNRVTLSRPRYCCIASSSDELYFTFFDPLGNVRPTGATNVGVIVAGIVAASLLALFWMESRHAVAAYHSNMHAPPLLALLAASFFALLLGGMAASIWYVTVIVLRWAKNRFAEDGKLHTIPLRLLDGFQVIGAGDAGAVINGSSAKSGHGLAAVFSDNTQLILTRNAWEYASIVDKHRELNAAFRGQRDVILGKWTEARKLAQAHDVERPAAASSDGASIPHVL